MESWENFDCSISYETVKTQQQLFDDFIIKQSDCLEHIQIILMFNTLVSVYNCISVNNSLCYKQDKDCL